MWAAIPNGIRSSLSLFHSKALKRWLLSSVVLSFVFAIAYVRFGGDSLYHAVALAQYIGLFFGTGLVLVDGASLFYCSQEMQARMIKAAMDRRTSYLSILLVFMFLCFATFLVVTAIGVTVILILSAPIETLSYLPFIILPQLVLIVLLSPLAVAIAMVVDNLRQSLLVGILLSLGLLIATGLPGFPVYRPEVALLGPAHIYSAIFFLLVLGLENPYSVQWMFGITFTALQLMASVALWSCISILTYFTGRHLFPSSIRRWQLSEGSWLDDRHEQVSSTSDRMSSEYVELLQQIKLRRKYIVVFSVLFVLVAPLASISYTTQRLEEWTEVVYESPSGGEIVQFGEWMFGAFTGRSPSRDVTLVVGCEGEILEGGGNLENKTMNFEHIQMTLTEFLELNATELEDRFGRGISGSSGATRSFSTGWGGPINDADYIWVLRFLSVGGLTAGSLRVSFKVMIRAHPY